MTCGSGIVPATDLSDNIALTEARGWPSQLTQQSLASANAVTDAIGIRVRNLPATPRQILEEILDKREAELATR